MKETGIARYGLTIIGILIVWYGASWLLGSYLLPTPHKVMGRMVQDFAKPEFWGHLWSSSWRIAAGTTIAFLLAVPVGLALGTNPRFDRLFAPLIYFSYPVPKIVFLPIILLLFGLGDMSKIVLITLIIFFQLLIPTRDAVRHIETEVVYALKSIGGTRWDYYRHVVWPIALPGIFTSLRIGTGTAVAVLFFVESISARRGLGLYLIDSWGRADYAGMFVGIIALSAIGVVLYELFEFLEKKLCRWRYL